MVYFYCVAQGKEDEEVQKKNMIVMSTLLMTIVLLGVGTIAYFRRTVNGTLTAQTGKLMLVVNSIDSVQNQSFTISLNRGGLEPYVMPGDKGTFNVNVDSTGSTEDVDIIITISRDNLPNNLKFYLDNNYTKELISEKYTIKKADSMTKIVPVYWYWDGSVDDENDTLFMGASLSATINVSVTSAAPTLYDTLLAQSYTLDTNVDFNSGASETNGQGLMMVSSTQSDTYPVLYYRGNVSNNNVAFADYCWLIVRTTETGGVKLIYNGIQHEDGSCPNRSYKVDDPDDRLVLINPAYILNESYFYSSDNDEYSPVHVGYMFKDVNLYMGTIEDSQEAVNSYFSHLEDNTIDASTGRHTQNLTDSHIKDVVDAWYEANIKDTTSEDLLEDAVWCNDRNATAPYTDDYGNQRFDFEYSASGRIGYYAGFDGEGPSLTCTRNMDKFTVESENGNGDLDYPIGLLTGDEINMAGHPASTETISYLDSVSFYSMTPAIFTEGISLIYALLNEGLQITNGESEPISVRPAISLKHNTSVVEGDGSFEKPYKLF